MKYQGESYGKSDRVELGGNEYVDCQFVGCELVFRGGKVSITGNTLIQGCKWTFEDEAFNTVTMLKALYDAGLTQGVDLIIAAIRSSGGRWSAGPNSVTVH